MSPPSNSFTFLVVLQFFMVSCYKLLKVMSIVIIQVNKKLGRHYTIDNESSRVDFFSLIAMRYKKSLCPIKFIIFVKICFNLQRERLELLLTKMSLKKCAIKKCIAMNFVKNRERGQAGVCTFFQTHNFLENGSLKNCATKKCLNLICILFFLFKAGDFSKKNGDNTFFLWGGIGLWLSLNEWEKDSSCW